MNKTLPYSSLVPCSTIICCSALMFSPIAMPNFQKYINHKYARHTFTFIYHIIEKYFMH